MGKHGNGDNLPPEGDRWPEEPAHLPDLPAMPHGVTIPDDLSALGAEAERIRAEFEQEQREQSAGERNNDVEAAAGSLLDPDARVHREIPWFVGGAPSPRSEPSVGMPLIIMSVAVLITVVSLFAMLLSDPGGHDQAMSGAPMPELVLTDHTGRAINVASLAPAAFLFVESCACDQLIADTVQAAPPGVTVVVVGASAVPAELPPGTGQLVLLEDPNGDLRSSLGLATPVPNAATVLVADQQEIIRTTPATDTVESYRDALVKLTDR